jgi:uncharacterized protein (TIGR03435 family)
MHMVLFLLLCAAAFAQDQTGPAFEVASIKPHVTGVAGRTGIQEDPGQIVIENLSLRALVSMGFGLKGTQQLVAPGWLNDVTFDIVAKPPVGYKHDQLRDLVRNLLVSRFQLATHTETRPISAFSLVVAKSGSKLQESPGPRTYLTGRSGLIEGKQRSIDEFAGVLTRLLGAPVQNETGLAARYDLKLEWTPDSPAEAPSDPGPSLFTALQEQLGLRLQATKTPATVVVVDRIERTPTAN